MLKNTLERLFRILWQVWYLCRIKPNIYQQIFEMEFESWSTDENLWPAKLNYSLFQDWFEIEVHSEVFDFGEGRIEIDEY